MYERQSRLRAGVGLHDGAFSSRESPTSFAPARTRTTEKPVVTGDFWSGRRESKTLAPLRTKTC
jgi:hypothetical protein